MSNYWLVKQEPEAYSWQTFLTEKRAAWTGVRNFQARNNLRTMASVGRPALLTGLFASLALSLFSLMMIRLIL